MSNDLRLAIAACLVAAYAIASNPADPSPALTLDETTREHCLTVLREGLAGPDFWPAMHAAEGLTLAGQPSEVLAALGPRLPTETDDQKRCGLARELARAGDRKAVAVLLEIISSDDAHGHTHAAESLFKIGEIGDGTALRRAAAQNEKLPLQVMAHAALARKGDPDSLAALRKLLDHPPEPTAALAGWALGQLGHRDDISRVQARLKQLVEPAPRAHLQHALALLGDAAGLQALQDNLRSEDPAIRTYAANFAGEARAVVTADRLRELLTDPFADARIRAAQSLLMLSALRR